MVMRHDQKCIGKARVLPVFELVQRLPRDEHRHHDCLAGTGRHLQRHARKARVRRVVCRAQIVLDPRIAVFARDLGDVNRRFHRLDLTKEQRLVAHVARPVPEQSRRRPRHADVAGPTPRAYPLPDSIDDRVRLDPIPGPLGFKLELLPFFLRAGDRHEVRAGPAAVQDLVCDAVSVELEMAGRLEERRVEDGIVDHSHTARTISTLNAQLSTLNAQLSKPRRER
jgi:hypothetical protein